MTIRGSLKLFYHSVGRKRNSVWIILKDEYVSAVVEVLDMIRNVSPVGQ